VSRDVELAEPLDGPFDLYETEDGPRHVGNPVRRLILAKMRGRELTVPEMIGATGLSKSTISTHLALLHREKMVAYREDPADRRRKRYYLTGRHVGGTRPCSDRMLLAVTATDLDPKQAGTLVRLLLRGLVTELACSGLDLAPVVRETGRRVGELVGQGLDNRDFAAWAVGLGAFWEGSGLGRMTVTPGEPALVIVEDCRLCCPGGAPVGLCALSAGIIEGMASEAFRTAVDVRELREGPSREGACGCRFALRFGAPGIAPAKALGADALP